MANKINVDASEVINNIDNLIAEFPSRLANGVEQASIFIEGEAKDKCPTGDTGILRASFSHFVETDDGNMSATGYVGSNVGYAPFVHQGTGLYAKDGNGRKDVPWHWKDASGVWHSTSGQKPQPFLQDAIDQNRNKLIIFFRGLLDG